MLSPSHTPPQACCTFPLYHLQVLLWHRVWNILSSHPPGCAHQRWASVSWPHPIEKYAAPWRSMKMRISCLTSACRWSDGQSIPYWDFIWTCIKCEVDNPRSLCFLPVPGYCMWHSSLTAVVGGKGFGGTVILTFAVWETVNTGLVKGRCIGVSESS